MISAPNSGRNLQTVFSTSTARSGFGIKTIASSEPTDRPHALFISSARSPCLLLPRVHRYHRLDLLKPWQVEQLHIADSIARLDRLHLNLFLSIFWEATLPGSISMPSTFRRGMKRMGQWLRDNGVRFAFIYVHENPGDIKLNSHLLVHVPAPLRPAFCARAGGWFDASDNGVRVEPRSRPGHPDTRLGYMAKGSDDFTCRRFGGRRYKGGQGTIFIKRSGVAQCLRPKTREFSVGDIYERKTA